MARGKKKNVLKATRSRPPRSTDVNMVIDRMSTSAMSVTRSLVRTTELAGISSSGTSNVYGAYSFQLADLPNYTEFTDSWIMYRLDKVELMLLSERNVSSTVQVAGSWLNSPLPFLHVVFDPTAASSPASVTELFQYDNHQVHRVDSNVEVVLQPRALTMLYESGVSTGYGPMPKSQFVSTTDPTVKYYGVKYALQVGSDPQVFIRVFAKYHLTLKGIK